MAIFVTVSQLYYPMSGGGRGAFPSSGLGGTLDFAGMKPGKYYRAKAPEAPTTLLMPGLVAFRAIRDNKPVSVNDFAVYSAVKYLQGEFGETVDGILGPKTDAKVKAWQASRGIKADGVFGPQSSRTLLSPKIEAEAKLQLLAHFTDLAALVRGHITYESGWDPGAVGRQDPRDLGIAQIHLPAHPEFDPEEAFTPSVAIPWMVRFVQGNLEAMDYNVRDAVAAYNLGKAGARSWIAAGRPQYWKPEGSVEARDMWRYINNVLAGS